MTLLEHVRIPGATPAVPPCNGDVNNIDSYISKLQTLCANDAFVDDGLVPNRPLYECVRSALQDFTVSLSS